ncbi:MAG: holo-[acyl-carrier-protein] synthase [Gammaproteobacteria bacterium]|nr:MAG: holo-[acyl-carrier-protein] synthase [Gammaproteobacteria bacterium]
MVFTNLGEFKLEMKINSGIDLVEVDRLKSTYKNFGERFLNRVYDPLEIDQFNKKSNRAKPNFLAKNFAAKEAVSKVLGVGFSQGVRPKDIVVIRKYGPPQVELKGKAKELAFHKGIENISLSLSDTDRLAVAVAQAIIN